MSYIHFKLISLKWQDSHVRDVFFQLNSCFNLFFVRACSRVWLPCQFYPICLRSNVTFLCNSMKNNLPGYKNRVTKICLVLLKAQILLVKGFRNHKSHQKKDLKPGTQNNMFRKACGNFMTKSTKTTLILL